MKRCNHVLWNSGHAFLLSTLLKIRYDVVLNMRFKVLFGEISTRCSLNPFSSNVLVKRYGTFDQVDISFESPQVRTIILFLQKSDIMVYFILSRKLYIFFLVFPLLNTLTSVMSSFSILPSLISLQFLTSSLNHSLFLFNCSSPIIQPSI